MHFKLFRSSTEYKHFYVLYESICAQRSNTRKKKDLPCVWVSVFNTAGDRPSIKASWGLAAFSISCTRARWACADRGEYGSIICTQSLLYYKKIRPFLQLHWSAEFQCVSSCKTMIFPISNKIIYLILYFPTLLIMSAMWLTWLWERFH